MTLKFNLIFLLLLSICNSASGQVKLPSVFSDNMVLQQKSTVELWGTAFPSSRLKITTSWDNKKHQITTGANGSFSVSIATPKAGGPYTMSFDDGTGIHFLENILIGEVWFCAGQSNMEMALKGFKNQPILNSEKIIAQADNPYLRLFTTAPSVSWNPERDNEGIWEISSPQVAEDWSALAYQFGQMLQERLQVPVGIIVSSWGGTPIKSWMSKESLEGLIERKKKKPDTITSRTPAALFNGMVAPFKSFKFAGILWYQGESDHNNFQKYKVMMTAMVKDWRNKFDNETLPFYFVQIAPWVYSPSSEHEFAAYFREMQYDLSKELPHSGIAVTLDIGSDKTIHPPNKTLIAERLLQIALANNYEYEDISYLGPEYSSMEVREQRILLKFRSGEKLILENSPTVNFQVAGEDNVYYDASAIITDEGIEVISEQVTNPVSVRYGFKNYVQGNLFNDKGLPATSFRTDKLKNISIYD